MSSILHMHWVDDRRWNIQKGGRTNVMGSDSLFLFPKTCLMYCSRQVCMEAQSWPTCSVRVSWSFPCSNSKSIRADGRIRTRKIFWLYRHYSVWAQGWFILSRNQNELLVSVACSPGYHSWTIRSLILYSVRHNTDYKVEYSMVQERVRVSKNPGCDYYRSSMACYNIFQRHISQSPGRGANLCKAKHTSRIATTNIW